MKFFDLEMNDCLAIAKKQKGGGRDVFHTVIPGHYGCFASSYTDTGGQFVSVSKCNTLGEWHVLYPFSFNCEEQSR